MSHREPRLFFSDKTMKIDAIEQLMQQRVSDSRAKVVGQTV